MTDLSIWGYNVPATLLTNDETDYLRQLPEAIPKVAWIWQEMDRVWRQLGLDNTIALDKQPIGQYYQHPVWLMNGIFTASDPESVSHREAIASYLCQSGAKHIADYAGGFGELAIAITRASSAVEIRIIEPYPSKVGLERLKAFEQISIVSQLAENQYDAIVAQDILEHVEDPIKLAYEISSAVRVGGTIVFANCFYPVIQCHLPSTFHLRCTFVWVMQALGLRYVGKVDGVPQAQVFERTSSKPLALAKARQAEAWSMWLGPPLNFIRSMLSWSKHQFMRFGA